MADFTVIQHSRVLRVKAKSIQALTKALRSAGERWQAIHEDLAPTAENLAKKVNHG